MLTHEHVDFFLNDRQNNCQTNNPIPSTTKYVLYLLQTLSCWFQPVRCCTLMHSVIQRKCSMNVKVNLCMFNVHILWTIASNFNRDLSLGVVRLFFSCNSWKFSQCKFARQKFIYHWYLLAIDSRLLFMPKSCSLSLSETKTLKFKTRMQNGLG